MEQPSNNNNAPTPRRRFRLNAKNLFLTYPQCDTPKEFVLEKIKEKFGENLEFAVVCEEDHAEREEDDPHAVPPGRHLHAVISLKAKQTLCGANCLDSLANSHGNYKAARHLGASVKYVAKDGDFIAHGVDVETYLEAVLKKKSTKATLIATRLMEGATLKEINEQDPGYVMMHLQKLQKYIVQLQVFNDAPTLTWHPLSVPLNTSMPLRQLANWLNQNLGQPRELRQKQLLLSSPPGLGKTTLVEHLRNYFTVYSHVGSKWFDGFDDGEVDLIVFDEFCGNIPITVINKVLDGQRCVLENKGGALIKNKRQPVIILTNFEEHELYRGENVKDAVRDAFFDRVTYIRLGLGDEPWRLIPFMTQPGGEAEPVANSLDDDPTPDLDLDLPPHLQAASSSSSSSAGQLSLDSSFYLEDGGSFGFPGTY